MIVDLAYHEIFRAKVGKGVIKVYSYIKNLFYVSIEYIPFKHTEIVYNCSHDNDTCVYRRTNRCITTPKLYPSASSEE